MNLLTEMRNSRYNCFTWFTHTEIMANKNNLHIRLRISHATLPLRYYMCMLYGGTIYIHTSVRMYVHVLSPATTGSSSITSSSRNITASHARTVVYGIICM